MKKIYLLISLLFFTIAPNLYSNPNLKFVNNVIRINAENTFAESSYYISIKYDDTDLTKLPTNFSKFTLNEENYKLTEATETRPFYINISDGILFNNLKFEITIQAGEFIGLDYNNQKRNTGVIPIISPYNDYATSNESNLFEDSLTITKYLQRGNVDAQHLGAFTIKWSDGVNLSAGSYTSTNTIIIKSEIVNI